MGAEMPPETYPTSETNPVVTPPAAANQPVVAYTEPTNQIPQRKSHFMFILMVVLLLIITAGATYLLTAHYSKKTEPSRSSSTRAASSGYVTYSDNQLYYSFNVPDGCTLQTRQPADSGSLTSFISEPLTVILPPGQTSASNPDASITVWGYLTSDINSVYDEIGDSVGVNTNAVAPTSLTINGYKAYYIKTSDSGELDQVYIVSGQPSGPSPGFAAPSVTVVFELSVGSEDGWNPVPSSTQITNLNTSASPVLQKIVDSARMGWGIVE
jgi:hypothetical protein